MNAPRNRTKLQNRQLNQSLEAAEWREKKDREVKKLRGKQSEILFDLGKLVFGGVIVGGVFEKPEFPIALYLSGISTFIILMLWGYYLYVKSIKER